MKRAVVIILIAFASLVCAAQIAPQHHRCWDIDLHSSLSTPHSPLSTLHSPLKIMATQPDTGTLLVEIAQQYLGTPYHFGGRTPKAFDCAGFALFLYKKFGYDLPGWSGAQAKLGIEVSDTRNLKPGDLVFFGGRHNKKAVGHTGIVVIADSQTGDFRFIHASTGAGVIISRSTEPYYKQRYLTARRLLQ